MFPGILNSSKGMSLENNRLLLSIVGAFAFPFAVNCDWTKTLCHSIVVKQNNEITAREREKKPSPACAAPPAARPLRSFISHELLYVILIITSGIKAQVTRSDLHVKPSRRAIIIIIQRGEDDDDYDWFTMLGDVPIELVIRESPTIGPVWSPRTTHFLSMHRAQSPFVVDGHPGGDINRTQCNYTEIGTQTLPE